MTAKGKSRGKGSSMKGKSKGPGNHKSSRWKTRMDGEDTITNKTKQKPE